jgi:arylsulfatase A-like enzyme
MYDQITRVPQIVWAPGRFPGDRCIEGLCQSMDIGPTILEMAGLEVPQPMAARSLLPVLKNDPGSEACLRDVVYAEQARDGTLTDTDFVTMIRTNDWKLVHFLEEPWGQLFNLNADPQEDVNLWDNLDYVDKKRELLAQLREWRVRDGYDNADLWQDHR